MTDLQQKCEIKRDENGRRLCTPERPWVESDGFPVAHQGAHEVGEQDSRYPGGDIVRMRCEDCGATWKQELPQ